MSKHPLSVLSEESKVCTATCRHKHMCSWFGSLPFADVCGVWRVVCGVCVCCVVVAQLSYFELTVLEAGASGEIGIGIAHKQCAVEERMIGWDGQTYGYHGVRQQTATHNRAMEQGQQPWETGKGSAQPVYMRVC